MHGSTHTLGPPGWRLADGTGTRHPRETAVELRRKMAEPRRPAAEPSLEAGRYARGPRRPRGGVGEFALFAVTLAAFGGLELAAALLAAAG